MPILPHRKTNFSKSIGCIQRDKVWRSFIIKGKIEDTVCSEFVGSKVQLFYFHFVYSTRLVYSRFLLFLSFDLLVESIGVFLINGAMASFTFEIGEGVVFRNSRSAPSNSILIFVSTSSVVSVFQAHPEQFSVQRNDHSQWHIYPGISIESGHSITK